MVVGFDGSSTVKQFVNLLNTQANIRECSKSGFALYSDDPIDRQIEHLLDEDSKLADIISRWELALRERRLGKFENTKVVRLYYKSRLYLKEHARNATEKEKLLTVYQINQEVMAGRFPTTQDLTVELCALLSQIEFGSLTARNFNDEAIRKVITKFYPPHLLEHRPLNFLIAEVKQKWRELEKCTTSDCVRIYLNCARKWSFCGSQLFQASAIKPIKLKTPSYVSTVVAPDTAVWLAVNDEAVAVLDLDTMHVLVQYPYQCIITFGGCREDFMLVVNNRARTSEIDSGSASGSGNASSASDGSIRHDRLLFAMEKRKILQLTLLIADYINARPNVRMAHLGVGQQSSSFADSPVPTETQHRIPLPHQFATPSRKVRNTALQRSHTRI